MSFQLHHYFKRILDSLCEESTIGVLPRNVSFTDTEPLESESHNELFAEGTIPSYFGRPFTPGQEGPHEYDFPHDSNCDGSCIAWDNSFIASTTYTGCICFPTWDNAFGNCNMLRTIYENENRRNRKLGLTMKFEEERSITEGNDVDMAYPYASVD